MKKTRHILIILMGILIGSFACNKDIVPSVSEVKEDRVYEDARFNSLYVEAIKQKLLGNNGDALKYLEQCIKMNPESDASYYQMAQILIAGGDLKNGRRFAEKALSIDQSNSWYLMMLAGIYYQNKDLDSAIIYYEIAVKNFPDKENLQFTLANLYSEKGNYERAGEIFNSLDEKYGVNEKSTVSAIQNLLSAQKYEEALEKTKLLLKEYPDEIIYNGLLAEVYRSKGEGEKAMQVYENLLKENPEDPQTQLALCDFLIDEKSYEELFKVLNTVILNDNIKREDKISLMASMIERPDIVKDKGNSITLALIELETNYENDDIIQILRPELLVNQGNMDAAAVRLEEIIERRPGNYYAWEKLLIVYAQKGDYLNLEKRGKECATRFNRSYLAKLLYANGALENGNYSIALNELDKAEILAANSSDFINQVLTMRADVYYRMKEYDKAFTVFEDILKSDSNDLTVLNNYAYYLAEQDMKLKEAEIMARKVIETEVGNNTFLDTYAWVLYKRGKTKEAAKVMETIINSGEKPDAEWYEHYGYILKKQRKCAKAIENWNIALKLDSTKEHLKKEIDNCEK